MSDRPDPIPETTTAAASFPEPEEALRHLAALMGVAFAREIVARQHASDESSLTSADGAQGLDDGRG